MQSNEDKKSQPGPRTNGMRANWCPCEVCCRFVLDWALTFPKYPGWNLSKRMRWWCWPPALPRPPGCFLCFPTRPWPAETCPRFLRFFEKRDGCQFVRQHQHQHQHQCVIPPAPNVHSDFLLCGEIKREAEESITNTANGKRQRNWESGTKQQRRCVHMD